MKWKRPSSKKLWPVPPEFAEAFREGGHRKLERCYNMRNDRKRIWQEMAGGDENLKLERKQFMTVARKARQGDMAGRRKG